MYGKYTNYELLFIHWVKVGSLFWVVFHLRLNFLLGRITLKPKGRITFEVESGELVGKSKPVGDKWGLGIAAREDN